MQKEEFEALLGLVTERLTQDVTIDATYHKSSLFEQRVREILFELAHDRGVSIDLSPQSQAFPDIVCGDYGIEVKYTDNDTWRSIANSVFEGTKNLNVKYIYLVFGKVGGRPAVKWGRYEDCVMHVRTSHVPRFEVEINTERSLFRQFGVTYQEFSSLSPEEKMTHIRKYARGRLKPGERLWWLDDTAEPQHTLSLQVRLYTGLTQEEKRKLRAEATLLCPKIVKPSRTKDKYNDVAMYLLTYHGVLATQVRDLFSAGSVALRSDETRGGIYILRALKDIEAEMKLAANTLEDALFEEYWGFNVHPTQRINKWLELADTYAKEWTPSLELF